MREKIYLVELLGKYGPGRLHRRHRPGTVIGGIIGAGAVVAGGAGLAAPVRGLCTPSMGMN
jgi:hypothetical protein